MRRAKELGNQPPTKVAKYRTAEDALLAAARDPAVLDALSPVAFEQLMMELFRSRGYAVTHRDAGASGGDFVIESGASGQRVLIELKKMSRQNLVSVETVRRFLSTVSAVGALGMLVATSDYTAAALELAAGTSVALRTLEEILSAQSEEELLGTDSRGLAVVSADLLQPGLGRATLIKPSNTMRRLWSSTSEWATPKP